MFKFNEEEKNNNKTFFELAFEYFAVLLVFINASYLFVALCLYSVNSFEFGIKSTILVIVDLLFVVGYMPFKSISDKKPLPL